MVVSSPRSVSTTQSRQAAASPALNLLYEQQSAAHVCCPVEGCNHTCKSRNALGKHLSGPSHPNLPAAFLASHGFAACPVCRGGAFCLLPHNTINGWSSYTSHMQSARKAHHSVLLEHGTWRSAEAAARDDAVAIAAPGSLGSTLPSNVRASSPPSSDDGAADDHGDSAPCEEEVAIPALASDADLSCLARIDINTHVRRVARKMRAQELPRSRPLTATPSPLATR